MNTKLSKMPDLTDAKWERPQTTEGPDVVAWRAKEFEKLGFIEYLAIFLAQSDVDLRQMERMLQQGCDRDLALDIFFGGRAS